MAGGRPSIYTPELAAQICKELALGRSLRSVCREDSMPCLQTIFEWFAKYPEFSDQYDKAKKERAETFVEDLTEIADDSSLDPQRARLMVDTRKWLACKVLPKKYGEKTEIEHSGSVSIGTLLNEISGKTSGLPSKD
jgi:hypothetical protein